jgi:hypothetical protein
MNFALISDSNVFVPLQCLTRWLLTPKRAAHSQTQPSAHARPNTSPQSASHQANVLESGESASFQGKPLRVVRISESGLERCAIGRMRISGRMADVCAELDRLAAREAVI